MAEFKLVISDPKTGKTVQKVVADDHAKGLVGLKLGDTIVGDAIGFPGYEFFLAGGSDYCGFPMRADVQGQGRKKLLSVSGVGVRRLRRKTLKDKVFQYFPGSKQRKTVCGNTVHENISQLNMKITKMGKDALFEEAKAAPAEKPAEAAQA